MPPKPAIVFSILLPAITSYALFAQTIVSDQNRPSFEAASIRPNNLGGGRSREQDTPGRFDASMTTMTLIEKAYAVQKFQITGAPDWLDQVNYDIVAKTPAAMQMNRQSLQPYLQSLLAGRYNFKFHTGSKDIAGYALMPAKGGPKLKPHAGSEGSGTNSNGNREKITMTGTNITMPGLAAYLSREMDQIVVDESGLKGSYDVALEWSGDDDPQATAPSIFTALQEQLGLKLQAQKVPMEVIVVDSIEKPSEN